MFSRFRSEPKNLLVDEQGGLPISGVAHIEPPATFDGFIVEIVSHLRLRVSVNEPEQIGVLLFHTISGVMFSA